MDGDGDLDVLHDISTTPRIYLNPGPGAAWPAPVALPAAPVAYLGPVIAGDLDGALGPDILAPTHLENGLAVWLNTGPLTYAAPILIADPLASGDDPTLCDVDLDGDLDLLNSGGAGVYLLLNDGHAVFTPSIAARSFGSIAVDDFDGDGVPDLAVGDGGANAYQGQGDGTFVWRSHTPAVGEGLECGDVDGDGAPDLISRDSSNVVVLRNQGDFSFGPAVTWSTGEAGGIGVAQCADLDAEAGGELILGCSQQLFVMKQTDGAFLPHSGYALPGGGARFQVADMDVDGDLDAAVVVQLSVSVRQLIVLPGRAADPWQGLSGGLAGVSGLPELSGTGSLQPSTLVSLRVSRAAPAAGVLLIVGLETQNLPFKGGTLVPMPRLIVPGLNTGELGSASLSATWPEGLPSGLSVVLQAWITDAAAPAGLAATNALMAVQP
jgi:hypothetical protein